MTEKYPIRLNLRITQALFDELTEHSNSMMYEGSVSALARVCLKIGLDEYKKRLKNLSGQ